MKDYRLFSSLSGIDANKNLAEIDLSALRENYILLQKSIQRDSPKTRMIAVVKADAYGHGAPACVETLLSAGCDFFAVSCLDEALAVRSTANRLEAHPDILILGATSKKFAQYLSENDLLQTVFSEQYARSLLSEAEKKKLVIRVHLAVDSGMNRIGFSSFNQEEIQKSVAAIKSFATSGRLKIEGAFSHFARADEADEASEAATELQSKRFQAFCSALESEGVQISMRHLCNSAGALRCPQDRYDGVRLGILLYGVCPFSQNAPLRPVLKLKSKIFHLHKVFPGDAVGYGGDFRPTSERLIATLPIGYADGLLREYSGCFVSVQTDTGLHRVPIVGRICMDQCMLDVTGTDAKIGDTVTFFGNDNQDIMDFAKQAGTIPYECTCLISSRVIRKYIGNL